MTRSTPLTRPVSGALIALVAAILSARGLPTTAAQAAASAAPADAAAKARAQALLREGTSLFDRGEHAAALQRFQEAYGIFPSPKIWFDVGAADRALGRQVDAIQAFQRFLDGAPDAPADSRREAEQAIATLTSLLGRLRIDCALAGAEISVDGQAAGTTPFARPVWVTPGRHQIAARREGTVPDIQDATFEAGAERAVTLVLRPLAAPSPAAATAAPVLSAPASASVTPSAAALVTAPLPSAPSPDRPLTRQWWFWAAVGAVAAAGVAGVVLATRGGGTDVPKTTLGAQSFP